jgi:hypothetical protein
LTMGSDGQIASLAPVTRRRNGLDDLTFPVDIVDSHDRKRVIS